MSGILIGSGEGKILSDSLRGLVCQSQMKEEKDPRL